MAEAIQLPAGSHRMLGGSSVDRWTRCAPSIQLSYKLSIKDPGDDKDPGDTPSWYAFEGTVAHMIAEACMRDGQEPWEFIGERYSPEGDPDIVIEVDQEMASCVQVFVSTCRDIREKMLAQGSQVSDYSEAIEAPVQGQKIPSLGLTEGGTVDFQAVAYLPDGSRIVAIIDYKHGAGIYVPADADQLKAYALWSFPPHRLEPNETITYWIGVVQPRAIDESGGNSMSARTTEVGLDEMKEFAERLQNARAQIENPLAPFVVGKHCKWCPVKLQCPAIFGPAAEASVEGEPRELPNEALSEWLEYKDQIKGFLDLVEKEVYQQLSKGHTVPGYKLVDRYGQRTWKEDAEATIKERLGSEAFQTSLLSPAQLERVSKTGKELAQELAYKPHKGLTVAPASDKRDAASVRTAQDAFGSIAQS